MNDIWSKYEKCKTRMSGSVSKASENWDFYLGHQWNTEKGKSLGDLPFFNIVKPLVKFQVSTIAQNSFIPTFNEQSADARKIQITSALNRLLQKEWRLGKQKTRTWEIIKNAIIEGDSYQYCGTENPEDDQIISTTNIFFGDEGNTNIQEQPYIIIRSRPLVKNIKEIAKNYIKQDDVKKITGDNDKDYVIGDNLSDVEEKATSLLYLTKIDGIVHFAQAVKEVVYVPLQPVASKKGDSTATVLTLYPIVNYIFETIPNSARGNSVVAGIIPNQIEINKTLVRRSEAVKISAYPRIVFNGNAIEDESVLDKAGAKISVNGVIDRVKDNIDYLNSTTQSPDAQNLQVDLIQTTREINGSVDAITGATDPTRVSGSAVIALREQSELPLNEGVDRCKQFIEDLALVWLDMKKAYNPRDFMIDDIKITPEEFASLLLEVNVDVSKETPWTKTAEQGFLDNLLSQERITLEEYVNLSPDGGVVPKGKMIKMLAGRENGTQMQMRPEGESVGDGEPLSDTV